MRIARFCVHLRNVMQNTDITRGHRPSREGYASNRAVARGVLARFSTTRGSRVHPAALVENTLRTDSHHPQNPAIFQNPPKNTPKNHPARGPSPYDSEDSDIPVRTTPKTQPHRISCLHPQRSGSHTHSRGSAFRRPCAAKAPTRPGPHPPESGSPSRTSPCR